MTSAFPLYVFFAFLAGSMIACQSPINARLGTVLGDPIWASTVSFITGCTALVIISVFVRGLPNVQWEQLQWWMFLGGLMGAIFVTTTITLVPYLGVTAMLCLIVAGQLTAALLLDHFGVLVSQTPITPARLAGVGLVIAGALLTQKFK